MFKTIMVPVDLAHFEVIEPSLQVAADLAKYYGAEVHYVAVTATTPGAVAHTPEEYQQKLERFAAERAKSHGQPVRSRVLACADPVADLDDALVDAISALGADLVIMSTHPPKHLDVLIPSHGSKVASHTRASVFLVRPQEG